MSQRAQTRFPPARPRPTDTHRGCQRKKTQNARKLPSGVAAMPPRRRAKKQRRDETERHRSGDGRRRGGSGGGRKDAGGGGGGGGDEERGFTCAYASANTSQCVACAQGLFEPRHVRVGGHGRANLSACRRSWGSGRSSEAAGEGRTHPWDEQGRTLESARPPGLAAVLRSRF